MADEFRVLCAELVELCTPVDSIPQLAERLQKLNALADRARALLAQPVAEGPSDDELDELFTEIDQSGEALSWRLYARAALARWCRPTPQPVAVSERLPGDELCWWFEPDEDDGYGGMWTLLRIRGGTTRYTHWLPANALPTPEATYD